MQVFSVAQITEQYTLISDEIPYISHYKKVKCGIGRVKKAVFQRCIAKKFPF